MERPASIHSATILAFPVGGRREARVWGAPPTVEILATPPIDCDAWYHQAAIEEEEPRGNA